VQGEGARGHTKGFGGLGGGPERRLGLAFPHEEAPGEEEEKLEKKKMREGRGLLCRKFKLITGTLEEEGKK